MADREGRRAADDLRSSRRRPVLLLEEASQAVVLVEMEKEKEKRKEKGKKKVTEGKGPM